MIYLMENTDSCTEDNLSALLPFLSEERRAKTLRYRFLSDRINCAAAFCLLRLGLYREYGITSVPEFILVKNEKPCLADRADIHFNLSHCKKAVACIISGSNTAIDINEIRPSHRSVAARVCSPGELSRIEKSSDPDREFMRLWTEKECVSKLDGRGLSADYRAILSEPEAGLIRHIERQEYIVSYICAEKGETVFIKNAAELFMLLCQALNG